MSSTVATVEHYFGGCPECGGNDGYMNCSSELSSSFSPVNVCVCDQHKTAWVIGQNLVSLDEHDTPTAMLANMEKLKDYRSVEPLPEGSPLP